MPHGRATVYRLVLVLSLVLMGTPLALLAPPTTVGAEQPVEIVDLAPPRADETVTVRRGNQTVTFRPLKTVRLADGQEVVANRLVVGFHATVGAAERAAAHQQAGARGGLKARVVGPLGPAAQVIDVGGTVTLEAALQAYRADPRVRFAEPDSIERAFETPNDSFFDDQWGMAVIQAPTAWNTTHGSTARKIAILDCGIYEAGSSLPNGFPGHDDLNGKVVARRDFTGSATGSDDYCDHGTHVAGIASAITNNATGVSGVGWDRPAREREH